MLLLKYGRVDKEYSEQEIADLCDYKKEEVEELLEFFRNSYHEDKEMIRKLHLWIINICPQMGLICWDEIGFGIVSI